MAVDSVGNIYIADTFNNTIRKGYLENRPAVIVTAQPGLGFNGGQFGFMLTGPAGHLVVVEASIDLATWLPLWTNTFEGVLNFSDPQSGSHFKRFYRAHLPEARARTGVSADSPAWHRARAKLDHPSQNIMIMPRCVHAVVHDRYFQLPLPTYTYESRFTQFCEDDLPNTK